MTDRNSFKDKKILKYVTKDNRYYINLRWIKSYFPRTSNFQVRLKYV